jgi:hypothetical protein
MAIAVIAKIEMVEHTKPIIRRYSQAFEEIYFEYVQPLEQICEAKAS